MWLEKEYGKGIEITINYNGQAYTGTIEIPNEKLVDDMNYNTSYDLQELDAQYYIDYVI